MAIRDNQVQLIEATQQLLGIAIDSQEFDLVAAMSDVLKDLLMGLNHIPTSGGLEPVTKLRPPIGRNLPRQQNQQVVLPSLNQPPPSPPQPTAYVWGDGFQGVVLPTRKEVDEWGDS